MRSTILRTAPAVAVLALAVGVSGASGAVAATMITGKQIKDGTITTADVKDGNLTGKDVKDGSIDLPDTSVKLDRYEQRIGSFTVVSEVSTPVGSGGVGTVSATCPDGLSLLGSFAWWKNQNTGTQVEYHAPDDGPQYAVAYSVNANSDDDIVELTVTCGATAG